MPGLLLHHFFSLYLYNLFSRVRDGELQNLLYALSSHGAQVKSLLSSKMNQKKKTKMEVCLSEINYFLIIFHLFPNISIHSRIPLSDGSLHSHSAESRGVLGGRCPSIRCTLRKNFGSLNNSQIKSPPHSIRDIHGPALPLLPLSSLQDPSILYAFRTLLLPLSL
jgi:hypothetical protein